MANDVRPENMERIVNENLANDFIDKQVIICYYHIIKTRKEGNQHETPEAKADRIMSGSIVCSVRDFLCRRTGPWDFTL